MDIYTKKKRSDIMANVKSKDTAPEKFVRSILHKLGYRFTLHSNRLPGSPDIVLPRHKKVVFVNGCFWHDHRNCNRSVLPSTNKAFWKDKIKGNKARDARIKRKISRMGWKHLTLWQCSLKETPKIETRLKNFLNA